MIDYTILNWWDYIEKIGIPSNMMFSPHSEWGNSKYKLQRKDDPIRWCLFSVDNTFFVIEQELGERNGKKEWMESWTKQCDSEEHAFKSAEREFVFRYFSV